MSAHIETTQMEHPPVGPDLEVDRYEAVSQYSLAQILAVGAAAAVPMGVLAWIVAPWLRDQLGGDEALAQSLLILLTAGLIWQFVLVLILVRRELGGLHWSRVRDALWLRPPRDPKTGRVGGKAWWWALLFFLLFAIWALVTRVRASSSSASRPRPRACIARNCRLPSRAGVRERFRWRLFAAVNSPRLGSRWRSV